MAAAGGSQPQAQEVPFLVETPHPREVDVVFADGSFARPQPGHPPPPPLLLSPVHAAAAVVVSVELVVSVGNIVVVVAAVVVVVAAAVAMSLCSGLWLLPRPWLWSLCGCGTDCGDGGTAR